MKRALLLIDLQYDFCPGGALAVAKGDETIPIANRVMSKFSTIIATQDWHPRDHGSFAINHPGTKPYDLGELAGGGVRHRVLGRRSPLVAPCS